MFSQGEDALELGQREKYKAEPRPSAISKMLKLPLKVLRIARPAVLNRTSASPRTLRRTAYLDGIRGFAALLVYVLHHELWAHEGDQKLESGFGYKGQYYLACLPFLRNFFTGGHYAVATFFILSGYVLSAKPLALIHSGDYGALVGNLGSSLFRRYIRLYLPIVAATFITICLWHMFGIMVNFPPQKTFLGELWNWYVELKKLTWIFDTSGNLWISYNPHIWSIPVEFKGSIIVYTALMAFAKCTRNARLWCEVGLIFFFLYIVDGAYFSLFVGGMLQCDLDLLAIKDELPRWFSWLKPYRSAIFLTLFIISMLLGGVPAQDREIENLRAAPGWYYLSFLKPQAVFDYKWFYNFWAAMFLLAAAPRVSWLKRFFESRFCQYMGRISYMFYLVHGPVMWTIGDRLYAAVGMSRYTHAVAVPGWTNRMPVPRIGPFGMEPSFFVPHLIILPFTLWMAEIGTTLIDDPSVRFCAWLYAKTQASAVVREEQPMISEQLQ